MDIQQLESHVAVLLVCLVLCKAPCNWNVYVAMLLLYYCISFVQGNPATGKSLLLCKSIFVQCHPATGKSTLLCYHFIAVYVVVLLVCYRLFILCKVTLQLESLRCCVTCFLLNWTATKTCHFCQRPQIKIHSIEVNNFRKQVCYNTPY